MRARAAAVRSSAPTTPAPTTATRPQGPAPASHTAFSAVSMLAASTARAAGTPAGTASAAAAGTSNKRLVRMQREDRPAHQIRRPVLDGADRRVAVLHRKGKRARHERRAHALELRGRHATVGHQRFGAAADRAMPGAHSHGARRQRAQWLVADLRRPGATYHSARLGSFGSRRFDPGGHSLRYHGLSQEPCPDRSSCPLSPSRRSWPW